MRIIRLDEVKYAQVQRSLVWGKSIWIEFQKRELAKLRPDADTLTNIQKEIESIDKLLFNEFHNGIHY